MTFQSHSSKDDGEMDDLQDEVDEDLWAMIQDDDW